MKRKLWQRLLWPREGTVRWVLERRPHPNPDRLEWVHVAVPLVWSDACRGWKHVAIEPAAEAQWALSN